jgi:hypothetical protein
MIQVNLECISKDYIKEIITMPLEPEKLLEISSNLVKQMEFFYKASEALTIW